MKDKEKKKGLRTAAIFIAIAGLAISQMLQIYQESQIHQKLCFQIDQMYEVSLQEEQESIQKLRQIQDLLQNLIQSSEK